MATESVNGRKTQPRLPQASYRRMSQPSSGRTRRSDDPPNPTENTRERQHPDGTVRGVRERQPKTSPEDRVESRGTSPQLAWSAGPVQRGLTGGRGHRVETRGQAHLRALEGARMDCRRLAEHGAEQDVLRARVDPHLPGVASAEMPQDG